MSIVLAFLIHLESAWSYICKAKLQSPTRVLQLLAQTLPAASHFYLNYVPLQRGAQRSTRTAQSNDVFDDFMKIIIAFVLSNGFHFVADTLLWPLWSVLLHPRWGVHGMNMLRYMNLFKFLGFRKAKNRIFAAERDLHKDLVPFADFCRFAPKKEHGWNQSLKTKITTVTWPQLWTLIVLTTFSSPGATKQIADFQAFWLCQGMGSRSARHTLIAVTGLVFCTISPLITVLCFINGSLDDNSESIRKIKTWKL